MGFCGSFGAGLICDRFSQEDENPYSKFIMTSCLLSLPLFGLSFLQQDNFYLSLGSLGLNYLVNDAWLAPYVTMLQRSVTPDKVGFIITVYILVGTTSGTLATIMLDYIKNLKLDHLGGLDFSTPGSFEGFCLFSFVAISHLITVPIIR